MTAREVLDGIKGRPFITDETAERLTRAVEAVLELHTFAHKDVEPWAIGYRFGGDHCAFDGQHWPCPTVSAIENALNPKEDPHA